MSYLGWCGSDPRFYHLTLDFMILYLESSFGYTPLFPFRIIHSLLSALTIQTDTRWNWISWSVVWCNRSVLFLHTSFTIARSFSRDQLDIHPVLTYCRQTDRQTASICLSFLLSTCSSRQGPLFISSWGKSLTFCPWRDDVFYISCQWFLTNIFVFIVLISSLQLAWSLFIILWRISPEDD